MVQQKINTSFFCTEGSGKTLAFVLPVLNALANRKIRRLRALVVLPSRDLGKLLQVAFDFEPHIWVD